ncbi:leucine-rich repeat-containing protein 9-like [Huso huso]|uniref:Leucine-rich repeat-containing protein 9-like n=1 Tax=Huso huso TaxID=61971 RepID=A0ABR0Z9Z0_HUSHU
MTQSEKQKQNGNEDIIKELCTGNGISYEKVSQEGEGVTVLEMFFSGYPRMVGLSYFPNLTTLMLVGQHIQKIEGLLSCPLLKELWIIECQLTKIAGLQNCLRLQKLFLYDNKINKIENLELLEKLEVLWLNNNQIAAIEGMTTLKNLEELNLADNAIEKIGHCLDPNEHLERLNLSGNKICSFKELTHLARLPCLKELGLKDPQYSPNPVCLLCNYATHVLYHIPKLQRLDTYDVSNKQIKDAAESTVMKKMMYYNMRVKTIHRRLAEMLTRLVKQRNLLQQRPVEQIRALNFTLKNLERELSEIQTPSKKCSSKESPDSRDEQKCVTERSSNNSSSTGDSVGDPCLEQKLFWKLDAIKDRLAFWKRKMDEIETIYQQEVTRANESNDVMVRFLLIELETVGNIRFEEGSTSDVWFSSCYDLVLSRFCALDFKAYGVTGVKINRIIRVHNRILRLRFEEKLHSLLANEESSIFSQNYKKLLEYLFYVCDPRLPSGKDELLHVLENGFKTADAYKALGKERAVPLSNSISLCEQPRIEYLQSQAKAWGKTVIDPVPFRHGQIIVAKVFLGPSVQAQKSEPIDQVNYPKAHSVFRTRKVEKNTGTGEDKELACFTNQHRNCDCSLRQSEWFVFDHEVVLPEYIIDFEYIMQDRPQPLFTSLLDNRTGTGSEDPSSAQAVTGSPSDINLDEKTMNMEPVIKPRPKMISLEEKTVLAVAKANILSQITVLNLHGNSLNKLKDLSRLTALRKLIISFNEFTHLDDISHLPHLEYVDASYNRIQTLEGLRGVHKLKHLDLSWNHLTRDRDDIGVLRKHAPALENLDIRHNPWHKTGSLRLTVIGRLKTLAHLDGVLVNEEEAAAALRMAVGFRISQGSLLVHSRTDRARPRSLSLLSSAQILTQLSKNKLGTSAELEPGWYTKITALNLDGQKLVRLVNLDKLQNLRWASFNDNDISKIEGLENCQQLEELSLDGNCISRLEGISKMTKLTRFSLNKNQLVCLNGEILEKLTHLHYLSVENNNIQSLEGVQKASSLIELYIGNNSIATNRDIYHLKGLSNLIILDLYGNPLIGNQENYRLFVIFHLPALKALDGVAVELSESENAKDAFGGRLTPDMVAEKLGHSNYTDILQLDLPASSIRTVDLSPADLFRRLRSINLEHNNLTSFSGLIFLPNLKVLCLNHNHIDSILPRLKTQAHLSNRQMLYQKVNSSGYGQQGLSKGTRDPVPIESLVPIMESLEVLHLGYNGISSLANLQLSRLTHLKALFLQGNEISQIEGLEGLQYLRELVLDQNRIKTINETSFIGQVSLVELHLAENRIRELNNLQPLMELHRLFLGINKIQDISELEKLDTLPTLIELSVVGNPIARKMMHRPAVVLQLPGLQVLDGIAVSVEEKTRAELQYMELQCSPITNPALDINTCPPGLMPALAKAAPFRVTNVHLTGGLQQFLSSDLLLPHDLEDSPQHETTKHKKQKHTSGIISTNSRSLHAEIAFKQIRGGTHFPPTALMQQNAASRLNYAYPNGQEQEGRFHSNSAPRPPRM